MQRLPPVVEIQPLVTDFGGEISDFGVDRAVGEEAEEGGNIVGEGEGLGEGLRGEREDVGEVGLMGEEVGPDLVLDVEGSDLEAIDEEAEIGRGERGGFFQVLGGEEISDVDRAEENVHLLLLLLLVLLLPPLLQL